MHFSNKIIFINGCRRIRVFNDKKKLTYENKKN